MFPVRNLDSVRYVWLKIKAEGYKLYGFLLYSTSDHFFPEYIGGEGLGDIELWCGKSCCMFVLHSPSEAWIEYTKVTQHAWWTLLGNDLNEDELMTIIVSSVKGAVLATDDGYKTFEQVFSAEINQYLYDHEMVNVLSAFNLPATDHPCVILFEDIDDKYIWWSDMKPLVDLPERKLRQSLQRWFGSSDFRQRVKASKNA